MKVYVCARLDDTSSTNVQAVFIDPFSAEKYVSEYDKLVSNIPALRFCIYTVDMNPETPSFDTCDTYDTDPVMDNYF